MQAFSALEKMSFKEKSCIYFLFLFVLLFFFFFQKSAQSAMTNLNQSETHRLAHKKVQERKTRKSVRSKERNLSSFDTNTLQRNNCLRIIYMYTRMKTRLNGLHQYLLQNILCNIFANILHNKLYSSLYSCVRTPASVRRYMSSVLLITELSVNEQVRR